MKTTSWMRQRAADQRHHRGDESGDGERPEEEPERGHLAHGERAGRDHP